MHPKQLRLTSLSFLAALLAFCAAGTGGADDFKVDTKVTWSDQGTVVKGKSCLYQSQNCTGYSTTGCYDADGNSSPQCTVGSDQPSQNAGTKLQSAVQYGFCVDPTPPAVATDPLCADPFRCAVIVLYRDVQTINMGGVITKTCSNATCYREIFLRGAQACEPGSRLITWGDNFGSQ